MKFNRLVLRNIGAFYGSREFNLETEGKQRNVVLFGGKNGSGKTTILDSLRIVLFGAFAFGLKNESTVYHEKIEAKLNTVAKKNNDPISQIILDLEMVENLKKNIYTLNRMWTRSKNSIKESFIVHCNGKPLEPREIELFQTKLRDETPPQLLEFCLFDGEKISQVISRDTLSSYLQQTARVMFNLDLFESLETDLETYIKQDDVYSSLSEDEKKLFELEQENRHLIIKKEELVIELNELDNALDEKQAVLADMNRQFSVLGGLDKKERDGLVKKMGEIETRRQGIMDKNRELLSTIFPFVMARDLLFQVAEQMEKEAKDDLKNEFIQIVSRQSLEKILASYVANSSAEEASSEIYETIINTLSSEQVMPIHRASTVQRAEIISTYKEVADFDPKVILNDFKTNSDLMKQVQQLRKKIDENDGSGDLVDFLANMNELEVEIKNTKFRKEQLHVLLKEMSELLAEQESQYVILKNKIMASKKMGHVFEIATKVVEVSRIFRNRQLKKKLQQVEFETARMLQLIFRKELFVTRVKIQPDTFELKIFDANHDEINIEILSAGEKQILLLSTVWAMAMCSKRRLPFVFDTLLGRLDQTHKKAIMEQFIPRCGEQVIILSTDSEINVEQYEVIRKLIAQTYTIDFDTNKSEVNVENSYFGMEIAHEV
ncbi:DNA sulfur modification protein DndD [Paenibacillus elgii]